MKIALDVNKRCRDRIPSDGVHGARRGGPVDAAPAAAALER